MNEKDRKDKQEFYNKFRFIGEVRPPNDPWDEYDWEEARLDNVWQWIDSKKAEWESEALSKYFDDQRELTKRTCEHKSINVTDMQCEICGYKFSGHEEINNWVRGLINN